MGQSLNRMKDDDGISCAKTAEENGTNFDAEPACKRKDGCGAGLNTANFQGMRP